MYQINEDKSIYVTRGDIVLFNVTAEDKGESYIFKAGDLVRIKVFEKKNAEKVVLQKDFPITANTESVEIFLEEKDTKIGKVINKPTDYWYEIELNPLSNPQTIIGYGEDGPAMFRLFPEGRDLEADDPVIKPEDIPVVDSKLDLSSRRPVENRVVAREIIHLTAAFDETKREITEKSNATAEVANENKARIDNLVAHNVTEYSKALDYLEYITEETKAKIDASVVSDGVFATLTVNLHEANLFVGGSGMDVFIIPDECRPIDTGLIHTEDGVEYRINRDVVNMRYCLYMGAKSDVTYAPEGAGRVTISYALADYELKDIRVGADGVTYGSAGTAVRGQIRALARANLKKYKFEYGGITGDDGTATNNRVRMRTFIPCYNNTFCLTNVSLPKNVIKATAVAYKDGVYVANVYSYVAYADNTITVTMPEDISVDELGLCFRYDDDSDISTQDIARAYVEHSASAYDIYNRIDRLNESVFVTKKPKRGVVSTAGVYIENTIALSTDFLACYSSEFTLKGMDGFVLLRCVGRSTDGLYSELAPKFKDGAYVAAVDGIESVAFSFYKSVANGIYDDITDEEYESATYSYMSSLSELNEAIENANKQVEFGVTKLAALGDSITYGFIPRNTAGYPGQLDSYAKLTADYYGMSFENHGISGSTVAIVNGASPMCQRVNEMPEDADVVVFMGGTNDIRKGVTLGTFDDRNGNTFYGALHVVMSALYEKYIVSRVFSKAKKTKIVVCTPLKLLDNYYASREGDGILVNLKPWVEAIKEVANYYSLPVLDFYNRSMINPHLNRTVKGYEEGYTGLYNPLITDGTHPTQEGAQLMANELISFLKCI